MPLILILAATLLITPPPALLAAASENDDVVARAVEAINERRFSDALAHLQAALRALETLPDSGKRDAAKALLHFHSAVALVELNDYEAAREELRSYVRYKTAAEQIDTSKYSNAVVALYREVESEPGERPGFAFDHFYPSPSTTRTTYTPTAAASWQRSPEFILLATTSERNQWQALPAPEHRDSFITRFWFDRDPTPETEANEFREEFERRVAYADHVFSTTSLRGALTDRGRVYVLLGSPDRIELITSEEDERATPALLSTSSETQSKLANAQLRVLGSSSAPRTPQRERWVYLPSRIPVTVPSSGVTYTFFRNDGDVVLEKEFFATKTLREVALLNNRR